MKIGTLIRNQAFDLERRATEVRKKAMEHVDRPGDPNEHRDRIIAEVAVLNRAIAMAVAEWEVAVEQRRRDFG